MKLLKLQASFGKLHDTLELKDGLNWITAPNEAGKSTWAAFLVAMFYGIDTSKHATKTTLPDKVKYKPWDGSPMQGTIDLEWQGKLLTIERRSTARAPMSAFRAYETATGLPIDELTGENCGEILLGAKREVFVRSALLRQTELAVTKDAELDKKLAALVTTADETVSYSAVEKRLREAHNAVLRNPTGQLPQCKARLSAVEHELSAVQQVQASCMELAAAQKQLTEQKLRQEALLERIGRAEQVRRARQLAEEELLVQKQEQTVSELQGLIEGLPEPQQLQVLQERCRTADGSLQAARMDALSLPAAPKSPQLPAVFVGKDADAYCAQAQADREKLTELAAARLPKLLPLALVFFALSLGAAAVGLLVSPVFFALCAALAVLGAGILVYAAKQRKQYQQKQQQYHALLASYGAAAPEELTALAANTRSEQESYLTALAEHEALHARAQERIEQAELAQAELLRQVQGFAPQIKTFSEVSDALRAAERAHDAYLAESRSLLSAKRQLQSLSALVGTEPVPDMASPLPEPCEEKTVRADYNRTVSQLTQTTEHLNLARGRISAMPDTVVLQAECEQLHERIAALTQTGAAISLASERLSAANDSLQARFSPKLSQLSGSYFGALTGGSYQRLYLDREMNIQVTRQDDPLQRPVQALSCGTADQLYFAVRLAMAELLLREDCPLILDDALINFDDRRVRRALSILRTQSAKRQIIAFSCHERDEMLLAQSENDE